MRAFLAIASLCLVVPACDDVGGDGGLRSEQFPDLRAEPDTLVFAVVPVGQTTTKEVVLRNAGGERIQISGITLSNSLDSREFQVETVPLPHTIGARGDEADGGGGADRIIVRVHYSPRDEGTDVGVMEVESTAGTLQVPISTIDSEAELVVQPDRLVYVAADQEEETREVSLQNLGNVPVTITDVYLSEETSEDFRLENGDARPVIAQGDTHEYAVTYIPRDPRGAEGTLVIETDNAAYARIPIPLRGDLPSADINVSPRDINFGGIEQLARSEPQTVLIENTGTARLTVSEMALGLAAGNTNEQFEVTWPDVPFELAPLESTVFEVLYAPRDGDEHRTSIAIHSNDPDESIVTVSLRGRVAKRRICVVPEALNFPAVALAQDSAELALRIANCGDLPLNVEALRLDGEGFTVHDGAAAIGPLDPLEAVDVRVSYHNTDLAQGVEHLGTLTVVNDTLDTPEVPVPLRVVGGGAPTCSLVTVPNRISFGLVSRGTERTATVELANAGTGHCEVRMERVANIIDIPLPGFEVPFFLTGPAGARRVAPGEFVPVEITFRPQIFLSYSAKYTVTYWDPFAMVEKTAEADLFGTGGTSEIHVIPGHLEFGQVTAGECASRDERITVYNTGIVDLCINDIQLEGECDEFFIVDRPVADEDGCIVVTRNVPAELVLVYEPADLGEDMCEVVFSSDADNNPELRVPISGEGVRERRQTDVFEQTSGRKVDVLFVVDNSGSMGDEQDNLADNFGVFIQGAEMFRNEYQLGVVTTDMQSDGHQGKLVDPRVMPRAPGIEGRFADAVRVGTNGAGEERGLEASQRALSDPLAFDTGVMCGGNGDCQAPDTCVAGFCGGYNRGFLRDDAALEVVYVSDEEDQSQATLNFYVDFLKNIKGFRNEALMHAHAIVGAVDGRAADCNSNHGAADAGRRYVEVANRTNGGVYSICDNDFGRALRDIGDQAFGLPVQFFLSRPAVRATIEVAVDGEQQAAGWAFDEPTNSIIFDDNNVPQPGQTIRVTYEARCFPRRGN